MNIIEQARMIREKTERAATMLSNEMALQSVELFPKWIDNAVVSTGERMQHAGILYECIQGHITQNNWKPDTTPALWKVISLDEFPIWVQPIGAQDAYQINNKVTHNTKKWISLYDNNVWEPNVYGWSEIP